MFAFVLDQLKLSVMAATKVESFLGFLATVPYAQKRAVLVVAVYEASLTSLLSCKPGAKPSWLLKQSAEVEGRKSLLAVGLVKNCLRAVALCGFAIQDSHA